LDKLTLEIHRDLIPECQNYLAKNQLWIEGFCLYKLGLTGISG